VIRVRMFWSQSNISRKASRILSRQVRRVRKWDILSCKTLIQLAKVAVAQGLNLEMKERLISPMVAYRLHDFAFLIQFALE
jgi:hypothetical protein